MRFTLLLFCSLLSCMFSKAQTLLLPTEKEATVKANAVNKVPLKLTFKVLDRPRKLEEKITFKDFNDGDASLGKDYEYPAKELNEKTITDSSDQTFSVNVAILPIQTDVAQKYFNLYVSYKRDNFNVTEKVKVIIDYTKEKDKSDIDTAKWSVDVITGGNLDFFNGPTFKNFAGGIRLYVPNFATIKFNSDKKWKIGIIGGIFNFQYFESDTSDGNIQSENYYLDPTVRRPAIDTTKYIRHIYALNSNVSYNNWGAYLDPMVRLWYNEWYDLFLDFHTEFVWRKKITTNTLADLRRDTFTLSSIDTANHIVLQSFQGIRPLYRENNYFDLYIGVGLPFKLNLKNAFDVYFEPTIGYTNFSTITRGSEKINGVSYITYTTNTAYVPFYLFKFELKTKIAPVDLVLGGEIRGIQKKQLDENPVFKAFYLGAILPLDKLKK